jgi:putative sterol carrier protein
MTGTSITEFMLRISTLFDPKNADGVKAVIQFYATGNETGSWYADIADGTLTIEQGIHPNPKISLTADMDDYVKLFNGKLDPMQAFMQGRLTLQGDMNLAMKLSKFFKMG